MTVSTTTVWSTFFPPKKEKRATHGLNNQVRRLVPRLIISRAEFSCTSDSWMAGHIANHGALAVLRSRFFSLVSHPYIGSRPSGCPRTWDWEATECREYCFSVLLDEDIIQSTEYMYIQSTPAGSDGFLWPLATCSFSH